MAVIEAQVRHAYARGYKAGAAETRERILKAAAGELPETTASVGSDETDPADDPKNFAARVERGAVRVAVQSVLARMPGLPINEIARRVTALDPRITSSNSVYNELSRNEDKLYRRSEGLWFTIPMGEFREDPTHVAGSSQSNGAAVGAA